MKRLLTAMLLITSVSAFEAAGQVEFATGYLYSLVSDASRAEDGYRKVEKAASDGIYARVSYGSPIGGAFRLRYGVSYYFLTSIDRNYPEVFHDRRYPVIQETGRVTTDEHYISFPVVAGCGMPLFEGVSGFVHAGISLSCCLSSKSYATWPNVEGTSYWNSDHFAKDTNYNGYRRFDVGLSFGIGLKIKHRVSLDCGIEQGILDRSEAAGSLRSFYWLFGASYSF